MAVGKYIEHVIGGWAFIKIFNISKIDTFIQRKYNTEFVFRPKKKKKDF